MIPKNLTPEVVKSLFNEVFFSRGEEYHNEGKVKLLDIQQKKNHRWRVSSEVQGSDPYDYNVDTQIEQKGNRFIIRGKCTCPLSLSN